MDMQIFDSYNLRVRICAGLVPVLPFAADAVLFTSRLPSFAEGVIFAALCIVFGQIILSLSCRRSKNRRNRNAAAELLAPGSQLSDGTRRRYYEKLKELQEEFAPLLTCIDSNASPEEQQAVNADELCTDAVILLRAKSRDRETFHLVHEENINYGFAVNMLKQKPVGILLNLLAMLLLSAGIFCETAALDWLTPEKVALCLLIHLLAILHYIFGVSQAVLDAAAKRYAYALLETLDII